MPRKAGIFALLQLHERGVSEGTDPERCTLPDDGHAHLERRRIDFKSPITGRCN
jgi:hypothetical protein